MNKIVSLSALRQLRPHWTSVAARLIDALASKQQFDGITELAEVFPLRIFPDAIGIRPEGRAHLLAYAAATFNAFGPRNAIFHATNDAAKRPSPGSTRVAVAPTWHRTAGAWQFIKQLTGENVARLMPSAWSVTPRWRA